MQPEKANSNTRLRFICRYGSIALGCIGLGLTLPGCGNILYTYRANSASTRLEEARQAGAEKTALYEYTLAREHLDKAMSEAAEADYGDAYELAELADGYAERAAAKARQHLNVPHVRPSDVAPNNQDNATGASATISGKHEVTTGAMSTGKGEQK